MEELNGQYESAQQERTLIKRTINGQEFTVLIHFQDGCRESAQEKVKRMLRFDVQNAEISV